MPKLAIVRDEQVEEVREYATLEGVAVNKLNPDGSKLLRTFVDAEPPAFDARAYRLVSGYDVQAEQVTRTWEAVLLPTETRADRVREITRQKIEGGFVSSALGTPHTYPSNETDQQNINANVVASLLPEADENWTTHQLCADEQGVWLYRPHTAEQIRQAGRDGKNFVMACLLNGNILRATIEQGGTPDLDAGWP